MSDIYNDSPREVFVAAHRPFHVDATNYPWINTAEAEVSTVLVELVGETSFRYGSLIGLNSAVKKIAASIPTAESVAAQDALFMGLPTVLQGLPHQVIGKVKDCKLPASTLFTASRGPRGAGLVFAIENPQTTEGLPVVLRAGISHNAERTKLLGALGINPVRSRRKKSS